jgi:hypothetical protein
MSIFWTPQNQAYAYNWLLEHRPKPLWRRPRFDLASFSEQKRQEIPGGRRRLDCRLGAGEPQVGHPNSALVIPCTPPLPVFPHQTIILLRKTLAQELFDFLALFFCRWRAVVPFVHGGNGVLLVRHLTCRRFVFDDGHMVAIL